MMPTPLKKLFASTLSAALLAAGPGPRAAQALGRVATGGVAAPATGASQAAAAVGRGGQVLPGAPAELSLGLVLSPVPALGEAGLAVQALAPAPEAPAGVAAAVSAALAAQPAITTLTSSDASVTGAQKEGALLGIYDNGKPGDGDSPAEPPTAGAATPAPGSSLGKPAGPGPTRAAERAAPAPNPAAPARRGVGERFASTFRTYTFQLGALGGIGLG
ncbi:MAG: hypothetical protein HY554_01210, partial [Elusimicrobia bacterium]|nr:hypothetical protein [Elusimicrobiota bacterium]